MLCDSWVREVKKILYEVYQENGCLDAMDMMKNRLVNNNYYCVNTFCSN